LMKVDKFSFTSKKSDTNEMKATMTIEKVVIPVQPMPPKVKNATNSNATP